MAQLHAVQAGHPADLIAAWDRIAAAGDALLPLDPDLSEDDRDALLERLRPASLTHVDPAHRSTTSSLPGDAVDDGTAAVVATSGSTGDPKGVILSRAALTASTAASNARLDARAGDAWVCVLPLHHVAGLQTVLRSRALGTEPLVVPALTEAALSGVSAAFVSLVPTQLRRALDAGIDLSRFRRVLLGGAPAPDQLLADAAAAGVYVVRSYGMTETCGGCVYDGVPLDGVDVATDADGRILIRGDVLFDGYHREPETTTTARRADGWFTTNDLGVWSDGRLTVSGRADDVLLSGGENVSAQRVRDALCSHPAISAAHVLGVPDPEWGERIVAIVVATDPTTVTEAEVRAHARQLLPPAAVPKQVVVVGALPLDGMGKLSRADADRLLGRA